MADDLVEAEPALMLDEARIDAIIEQYKLLSSIYADLPKAEREAAHQALADAQRIVAEHARATQSAKAADDFAVVVEVVEQVCKTRGTEAHASEACAKKIKRAVDAILRAKGMKLVGIGRLKRALGAVVKINSGRG